MAMTRSGQSRQLVGDWALVGLIMGIVAGVIFAMFEMIVAEMQGDGFWMPLRMIGAIVLGEDALESTYSLTEAAIAGLLVHMVLSAAFGLIFGVVAASVASLRESRVALVVAASIFGLALWLVNFYLIAPVAFEWFETTDPLVQFVAHTFFFGSVLGALLAMRRSLGYER